MSNYLEILANIRECEKRLNKLLATEDNSWSNQRDQADDWIDDLQSKLKAYRSERDEMREHGFGTYDGDRYEP